MAAVVELDESNGASEIITHAVATLAMGTVDATGMTPGDVGARQAAGIDSMQKALRLHLTALGGSTGIGALRVFCDIPTAEWSLWFNGNDEQSTYDDTKITAYVEPTNSTTPVPNPVPESDPLTPNLGIGGALDGELTGAGFSDYCYIQLRTTSLAILSFSTPFFIAYDDIG